jgi:hypothetical protein
MEELTMPVTRRQKFRALVTALVILDIGVLIISFVYLQINQQITLLAMGAFMIISLALMMVVTQFRTKELPLTLKVPGQPTRLKQYLVGMAFTVLTIVVGFTFIAGLFEMAAGKFMSGTVLLLLCVPSLAALIYATRVFDRYFPR